MDFIPSSNQLSDFRGLFYWGFIGHNFGDYKNCWNCFLKFIKVLSVTILETTKTGESNSCSINLFYRSQFWRLQKLTVWESTNSACFIGHNFGDYKNDRNLVNVNLTVLSVTILETTKTAREQQYHGSTVLSVTILETTKTCWCWCACWCAVLSVTILETTKTQTKICNGKAKFYRSQFWRLQKPE